MSAINAPQDVFGDVIRWGNGEKRRPFRVYDYCPCSTCQASKDPDAVAYLSGSNEDGVGISVAITSEPVAALLRTILGERHRPPRSEFAGG